MSSWPLQVGPTKTHGFNEAFEAAINMGYNPQYSSKSIISLRFGVKIPQYLKPTLICIPRNVMSGFNVAQIAQIWPATLKGSSGTW